MGDGNKRGAEKLCKIACESEKCDKKRNVGIYMKETFGIDIAENTTWGKNAFAKGVGGFGDVEFRTERYGKRARKDEEEQKGCDKFATCQKIIKDNEMKKSASWMLKTY